MRKPMPAQINTRPMMSGGQPLPAIRAAGTAQAATKARSTPDHMLITRNVRLPRSVSPAVSCLLRAIQSQKMSHAAHEIQNKMMGNG